MIAHLIKLIGVSLTVIHIYKIHFPKPTDTIANTPPNPSAKQHKKNVAIKE
jgi:hypothetical protein